MANILNPHQLFDLHSQKYIYTVLDSISQEFDGLTSRSHCHVVKQVQNQRLKNVASWVWVS